MPLSTRFDDALTYAAQLHRDQIKKVSGVPYVAHLLGVASLVLEYGGDEHEAIAGLLHDAIEDQGGAATGAEIGRRFGPRVRQIVEGCTDTDQTPKPPWRARKEAYIAHAKTASPSERLVSACDKLYNARSIVAELRTLGPAVWDRFQGGRDGTLWYYRSLAEVYAAGLPPGLGQELALEVDEMHRLAGEE